MRFDRRGRGVRGRSHAPLRLAMIVLLAGLAACDFLDPTSVENPRTTDADLAEAVEPVRALLPGLRAQMARMVGSQVVISELVSDNYSVHGTGISGVWDDPRTIQPVDLNATTAVQGAYWNTQELRALADFVLSDLAPRDEAATGEQLAEVHYYRGMALLTQGENFTHVPTEPDGVARPAAELLQLAVESFETVLSLSPGGEFGRRAHAALARAYRWMGNAGAATQSAQQALGGDPTFVFQQQYDATTVTNAPNTYLVVRALKEMQPLPRLDFLDPKYTTRESGIAVAKAEEMHLILAEAALASGSMTVGRGHLADAVELALGRGTTTFVDDDERLNADLSIRPRDSRILVRADPQSPFRAGLVLDRPGQPIPVPTVSGTSLDPDSVRALTDEDDIWHAFHLARQEILFLEGRRMADLGIRLPMMQREIDQNGNISAGSPGAVRVVPDYIPPNDEMNLFDPRSPFDANEQLVETEVTIRYDLNRILTQNRVTPF